MMINAFTKKLERWEPLSDADQATPETISGNVEDVERQQQLIKEGDDPRIVFLLLEGWAIRYKVLPNGKRLFVDIAWK